MKIANRWRKNEFFLCIYGHRVLVVKTEKAGTNTHVHGEKTFVAGKAIQVRIKIF